MRQTLREILRKRKVSLQRYYALVVKISWRSILMKLQILQKLQKNGMVLLVFQEDCLCRYYFPYVHILAISYGILDLISCICGYSYGPPFLLGFWTFFSLLQTTLMFSDFSCNIWDVFGNFQGRTTFRSEVIANFPLQLTYILRSEVTFYSLNFYLKTQVKGFPEKNASDLDSLRCFSCSLLHGRFFFQK